MLYNSSTVDPSTCKVTLTDSRGEYHFSSNHIIRLEAADNYTIIHFNNRQRPFVVSKVLKTYEEMLAPYGFVRTHRSHLINTSFVTNVDHFNVIMQDASVVELSKRNKTSLKKQLKEIVRRKVKH